MLPPGDTGSFNYWFHGAPLISNNGRGVQLAQLTCRAFIARKVTLDMRARILAHNAALLDMRGFILNSTRVTLDLRTRVSRQQGWPIPDLTDPAFTTFQPTQLSLKARVRIPDYGSQTFRSRARIFYGATQTLSAQARIVSGQNLTMGARIVGRKQGNVAFSYTVRAEQRAKLSMVFWVSGTASSQTLGMGARIAGVRRRRFTGYFLVTDAVPTIAGVQRLSFSGGVLYNQTIGSRAFITK